MLLIRGLEPSDHPALLRLNAASAPAVARLDAAELQRLAAIGNAHRIARDDRRMLGYLLAFASGDAYDGEEFRRFEARLGEPFLYVDQVAIEASARQCGVGRALYHALAGLARAQQLGLLCCEVNTDPPNPESLAFHLRMGFAQFDSMRASDGRTVALLRRELRF